MGSAGKKRKRKKKGKEEVKNATIIGGNLGLGVEKRRGREAKEE